MQPVTANVFEIKYMSGALMSAEAFGVCTIYISAKGVIKTTFERNMKYSDAVENADMNFMPVKVTYEYRLKSNITAELFEEFNLLELKPCQFDEPACDGGSWQMKIYTNGVNYKFKGFMAPDPFGVELADRIRKLIHFHIEPMLF
jgi:hypothetical protein